MTEKINQTTGGKFMRLTETITLLATELGSKLLPAANNFLDLAFSLIPVIASMGDLFIVIVTTLSKWQSVLVPTGLAIIAVVTAMRLVTLATVAYAKASAIAQAMAGPKGWAMLAIGALAAAAAVAVITSATEGYTASTRPAAAATSMASARMNELAFATERAAAAAKKMNDANQTIAAGMATMQSNVAATIASVNAFNDALAVSGKHGMVLGNENPLTQAFLEQESGFTSAITAAQNQLDILRGSATQTGLALADMLASGVDPAKVDELKKVYADITKQQEIQDNAEYWKTVKENMSAEALAIQESLMTPEQVLAKYADRMAILKGEGLLTGDEVAAAMADKEKDLGINQPKAMEPVRLAGAQQQGSQEAYSTIVNSIRRDSDPQVKATEAQTKTLVKELKPSPTLPFMVMEKITT